MKYFQKHFGKQNLFKKNVDKEFYNLEYIYNKVNLSLMFLRGELLNYYENDSIR